ncbi:A disintegrin and metalloproteinase with thrombospondin motifs like [Microplitis mediator]|uniref:A disintegrin and metalloproteinase with thrombospondin motifs like n=1 Tax=Microplitis mediator TaxID=375433 RepID=UPI002553B2ED|nr:A disintegrin and metalloproteinase with thrombospondin motifs like [Microplitis mediator]
MNRLAVLLFSVLQFNFVKSNQLHELMTDDEIQSIFQTDRDSVPEYETVPILHSMNKKNIKYPEVFFHAFGDDISLYLWPAEGLLFGKHTPVYTVQSDKWSPQGVRYTEYDEYGIYYAYRDENNNAAIIVRDGMYKKYKFDGTFNKNYVIRSLSSRIIENIITKNASYYNQKLFPKPHKGGSFFLTNHHVIFQMNETNVKLKNPRNIIFPDNPPASNKYMDINNKTDRKNNTKDVIYPEILLILDYDTFKSFGSDISETLVYLAAFWHGVDLRYRQLSDPQININLAAIIIALDKDATPYLDKFRVDDNAINVKAMKSMGQYLYNETRFRKSSYDIAVLMTKLQVCEWPLLPSDNSKCVPLRGISNFGSACVWNKGTKALEAVALVHDEGFNGIATAAHELAHILGVPHDGSASAHYIGGPGATKCKWEDGYLMSSDRFDRKAFRWSDCTIECFKFYLQLPMARCLYNKPTINRELPAILPGTLMSLDEQCYHAGALDACYHDERACVLLYCTRKNATDQCVATAPAAEGSTCGNEKICIQGRCINKRQWRTFSRNLMD